MKKTVVAILILFHAVFCCKSYGQAPPRWNKYSVSPAINTSQLNYKKIKSKEALEYNITNFYLYKNGIPVKPPEKGNRIFFTPGCLCLKFDDTLLLNSGLGRIAGVGVGIKIYDGKFTSSLHVNMSNKAVFKYHKSDSVYQSSLIDEPVTQSLKLLHRPSFLPEEIIIGEYNASYRVFYQKAKHDEAERYTVRLIFKCKVTASMNSKNTGGSK